MFDKLDDIIYKPIEAITDWATEPLKRWEHGREVEKEIKLKKIESEIKIKENESSVNLEIKKATEIERIRAEIQTKNKIEALKAKSDNSIREKEVDADLTIKKETEIKRILAEVEEFKKDKEFERMQKVTEAIMRYQEQLTRLNVNAINAIGNMQLDLREKAQQLVYDKTIKYKELQDNAFYEAANDLKKIEIDFSNNEMATGILIKAVDRRLANIIDTAHNFLIELNGDIKVLNQNISILTEKGQTFIEKHLEKIQLIDASTKQISQIENIEPLE